MPACQQCAVYAGSLLRSCAPFSPENGHESLQRLLTLNEQPNLFNTEKKRLQMMIKHSETVMMGLLVQISRSGWYLR